MPKITPPQFTLKIHDKEIGVDVDQHGLFHARTDKGETAKTLEGLRKSLIGRYPPRDLAGVPVEDINDGIKGIVVGRTAAPHGARGNYFFVLWKGNKTTDIVAGCDLSRVRTTEEKEQIEQFESEISYLYDSISNKENERDRYIETLCAEDVLNTAFPRRRKK